MDGQTRAMEPSEPSVIRKLDASEARKHQRELAEVLFDCVEGGASVHFMAGLTLPEAENFFQGVIDEVQNGNRLLLAAFDGDRVVGTVQVILSAPLNQPHRGEIAKLLVHRSARKAGVGQKLMQAAESAAKQAGKTLLILDTVLGDSGERLYTRCGWTRVGEIPEYALYPQGGYCSTVIFYKKLG